ncbi:DUF6773 family protein [Paenibacillus sp. FSL R5-0912]|uniref:DUF6773 family protein n=1 Tax=Paenibacillus sp. FSL R5-0912 TaxID=1536771 RepID=UPI0004F68A94|nr:DUF6773 family protein [Paenibacillus sp. FSL R5-0912]AIQ41770.1 hypothetical protein R50912_18325 [Paenibacillus sp. FSL R5-0912]
MKHRGIKDERIITEFQKLNSHGFAICFAGLMISLAVKVFILNWDIKLWLDTFLILMAACLYVVIRGIRAGLYQLPPKAGEVKRFKKMNLIGGLLSSVVWGALMFSYDLLDSDPMDLSNSIMSNGAGAVIFFLGITALQWLMIKRSNKNADKMLDSEN